MKKDCLNCSSCIPIGQGDHICSDLDTPVLIMDNYEPTEYYNCCHSNGIYRKKKRKIIIKHLVCLAWIIFIGASSSLMGVTGFKFMWVYAGGIIATALLYWARFM